MDELAQQDVYDDYPRPEVVEALPPGARRILDVGCGAGGFGATLRAQYGHSAQIEAIEAVPSQATRARSSGSYDAVRDGYYPDAVEAGSLYDLICFNDVLEHIYDPWRVLVDTKKLLNSGGSVVAAIPNVQYYPLIKQLIMGDWTYTDTGILDRTHIRFFTRSTMIEMFERAGYHVDVIYGANSRLAPKSVGKAYKRLLAQPVRKVMGDAQYLHFVIRAQPAPEPE